MGRETWDLIKHSKRFYVTTYRRIGNILFLSTVINMFLGCGLYYAYFYRPAHAFYATNGVTPPVELTFLDSPNNTPYALLPSENTSDLYGEKAIPQ